MANWRMLKTLQGTLELSPLLRPPQTAVSFARCPRSPLHSSQRPLHSSQRDLHSSQRPLPLVICSASAVCRARERISTPVYHHHSLHTSSTVPSSRRGHWSCMEDAQKFLAKLPVPQRDCLEEAVLEARRVREAEEGSDTVQPPTWRQLKLLGYHHALPFVGFGFLDNFIMITVGEYIDLTVGVALSISTMAAAGIGNLISDLAGLGLADRVEALCKLLGLPDPNLTPGQLQHSSSRWMGLLGRCLGISIGCILGMAPLLMFNDPHHKEEHKEED